MTIYDIAKLAGVSKSTVSRVLNQDEKVSLKSRTRVERVIREYNYIPNRNASMTKRQQKVVLVLVTRLDSYSETRLIRGMMQNADENCEFLIVETQFDIEKTKKIIENNKSLSAVVIFAISNENYEFLKNLIVPVVIVGQKLDYECNNLYFADYESMYELVKAKKVEDALFLGFNKDDKTMVNRYLGAMDAMKKELEYVTMCEYGKINEISTNQIARYRTFICATETIALQVYKLLLKSNISDYQILSAGNNQAINFVIDNYNTVDFHYKAAGKQIIRSLNTGEKIKEQQKYSLILNNE